MPARVSILIIAFLLTACSEQELNHVCPLECYTGPEETAGVGQCRPGITGCGKGNIPTNVCLGEILPYPIEICDGIDNNCDGQIDNNFKHDSLFCKRRGVCAGSEITCINGELSCGYPGTYEAFETKCDALDNDCDGLIDEDLFESEADRFCYSGPIGTELNPPCHAGRLVCDYGQIRCVNQVLPEQEVCDYIDNDCNGLVDENITESGNKYDIVLAIDTSESMDDELSAIQYALRDYISQFDDDPKIRFAVVLFSTFNTDVKLKRDFTSMGIALGYIPWSTNMTGREASYDSLYQVCDKECNLLGLDWDPEAKSIYIGFTDEAAQSYAVQPVEMESIISTCKGANVSVYHWSAFEDKSDFKEICDETGGEWFVMSSERDRISEGLDSIMTNLCED